jgi:hypothetical protein
LSWLGMSCLGFGWSSWMNQIRHMGGVNKQLTLTEALVDASWPRRPGQQKDEELMTNVGSSWPWRTGQQWYDWPTL